MTRLGTGENCLNCGEEKTVSCGDRIKGCWGWGSARSCVVNCGLVVRLVTSHCLRRVLLVDQGAATVGSSGSLRGVGLDGRGALGTVGDKAGINWDKQTACAEASSPSNSEERHGRLGEDDVEWRGST